MARVLTAEIAGPGKAIHACAVLLGETGVLILGKPGAGKSTLALQLLSDAVCRGMCARHIGDDRVLLAVASGRLIARPHPAIAGYAERRWEGIVPVEHESAAVMNAAVELVESTENYLQRLPVAADATVAINGIAVPCLRLPVSLDPRAQSLRIADFIVRLTAAGPARRKTLPLANSAAMTNMTALDAARTGKLG
ncbi:MAG: HPr kinase/phosphorylase [Beijerinckiaceae bacterium]